MFRPGALPVYDARYILRPETLESIFLAYRLTGDTRYRRIGWKIFQSIEKYCRLDEGGYSSILNVDDVNTKKDDKMETFWLVQTFSRTFFLNTLIPCLKAETLKYLYLLFEDENVIPLDGELLLLLLLRESFFGRGLILIDAACRICFEHGSSSVTCFYAKPSFSRFLIHSIYIYRYAKSQQVQVS